MAQFLAQLSPAEAEAACRYRRWQDRQDRVAGRLLIGAVLRASGQACDLAAMGWSPEGRPSLPILGDFNLSHSDGLVVCAWVACGRVGVDVEAGRSSLLWSELLGWMHPAERVAIEAAPDPRRAALLIWSAKEAVCKADGCGIAGEGLPDCAATLGRGMAVVRFRGRLWTVRSAWTGRHAIAFATVPGAVTRVSKVPVPHGLPGMGSPDEEVPHRLARDR